MRSLLITGALFVALAAQTPMARNIAVSRSFGNPGQVGLFMAASDGSDERPLLDSKDSDYDPVWAPDGSSIVFTSDRAGSVDLFRVRPDGTGLERLTTDPAYDDQAAFSPGGKQLVFVSTQALLRQTRGSRFRRRYDAAQRLFNRDV
jgi:Tol biopolymer transport system component